jgi:predicted ribosome quality control (RQC) complex YloA/Tae2 family protein
LFTHFYTLTAAVKSRQEITMLLNYFTADDGQPTGGTQPPQVPPPTNTGAPPETGVEQEKKFTQAELEQQIKDRLARQQRQFEAQQREAQAALEARQLEEQAEWQKLANKRLDKIKEIEPRAQLADAYEKVGKELLDVFTRDVPSAMLTLLEKLSVVEQLSWIAVNVNSIKPQVASGSTNINAYGRGAPAPALSDEEYVAKKRASGLYQ